MPNPTFLAKNESPMFRRRPVVINGLFKRDRTRHALCPVFTLHTYLVRTRNFTGDRIFFNPVSGIQYGCSRLNVLVRKLVRESQPGVYARFHDLRKFSAGNAFWANLTFKSIRSMGFWRSNAVLASRYLCNTVPSGREFVAMGVGCNEHRD